MKLIPLSQGVFALVDDELFDELSKYKWHAIKDVSHSGICWAGRYTRGQNRVTKMSHDVLRLKGVSKNGMLVNHFDRNRLNIQFCNLRICTNLQKGGTQRANLGKELPKGVSWDKRVGKYRAGIKHSGKSVWLGHHDTVEDAQAAYMRAAEKFFGEFAFAG